MKTFKQFMEQQKNDVPDVIKKLQGIAQSAKMDKKQAGNLKNKITNTVFDKLTGGAEGRQKGIEKIQGTVDKMSTDLPKAFDKFNQFLDSGALEQGFGKMKNQMKKQLK